MPKRVFYRRFPPRRKRMGITDYRLRLKLVKSGLPRVVVRRSNRYMTIQIVESRPGGDRTLLTVTSKLLSSYGWKAGTKNIPAAYLTGLIAGKKAVEMGITKAIADIGRYSPVPGSRVFAAIKGVIDAGLEVPMSEAAAPTDERLRGEHISAYYQSLPHDGTTFQFSLLASEIMSSLPRHVEEVKSKILSGS
ncbi:MAG: 50S ribosomal protein L18 [Halobacteria archaeon]